MSTEHRFRVVVDARWTRTDQPDGISRYGTNLITALHQLHPVTVLISDIRQLRMLPPDIDHVRVHSPFSLRELLLARTLHRLGADVVFTPLQVIGGFRRRYRLVLTLHDLIYYRHPTPPDFLPTTVRLAWRLFHLAYWPQRVLLNRADAVVTVSETTRRLIAANRLTRRPVHVVHNAPTRTAGTAPAEWNRSAADAAGEQRRELVYMGSFMPYKNVETLLRGMIHLPGHRLHLVSRIDPRREAQLRRLVLRPDDVVFWHGIDETDYQELLRRAAALVTASRDEGFGLPLIEAMHAGTPVVCSDVPIFHEVTGGAAEFFHADSPRGFAAAVIAAQDPETRLWLRDSGKFQAQRFSWDDSARRLLEVLRSVSSASSLSGTARGSG